MRSAWLNSSTVDSVPAQWIQQIVWPGSTDTPHPAASTAATELQTLLPWAELYGARFFQQKSLLEDPKPARLKRAGVW
jgi:hypothetical protein